MGSQLLSEDTAAVANVASVSDGRVRSSDRTDRAVQLLVLLTVVVTFGTYWLPMLTNGLRFDENLTGWVISGSFVEAVERSWVHQGQSPLYFMALWVWQTLAGSSELALRLPSMAALFVSCWQLQLLGKELDHRRVGQFAAIFLLVSDIGATDARPYVFMVLALIVSTRYGIRWLDSAERSAGLVWVVAAVVSIAMQPFAFYALVPHVVLAYRAVREGRARSLVGYLALGAMLVSPIVPQVLQLRARQETLVIAASPSVMDFFVALLPAQMCVGLVVGLVLDRERNGLRFGDVSLLKLVVLWAVFPAFGLFVQSHLTGSSVFVERYHFAALPAAALLVAMVLARVKPGVGVAGVASVVLGAMVFLTPIHLKDWYTTVEAIDDAPADADIWTITGYIESSNPEAFADDEDNEYLNAPIRWHGAEQELLAIPRTDIAANRAIIDRNIDALDRDRPTTVLLVEAVNGASRQSGAEYAEEALLLEGFALTEVRPELGIRLTTFTRE